jgi:DNA helicase IV
VRDDPGRLDVVEVADPVSRVATATSELLAEEGSVGVVVAANSLEAVAAALTTAGVDFSRLDEVVEGDVQQRVSLVPASLVKGLEFDRVLVVEPADIVDGEPDERTGLRRLYVSLTRAVTAMVVLHSRELPPELV